MEKISRSKAKKIGREGKNIYSLAMTRDQETLYAGDDTKTIKVYNLRTLKMQSNKPLSPNQTHEKNNPKN